MVTPRRTKTASWRCRCFRSMKFAYFIFPIRIISVTAIPILENMGRLGRTIAPRQRVSRWQDFEISRTCRS